MLAIKIIVLLKIIEITFTASTIPVEAVKPVQAHLVQSFNRSNEKMVNEAMHIEKIASNSCISSGAKICENLSVFRHQCRKINPKEIG